MEIIRESIILNIKIFDVFEFLMNVYETFLVNFGLLVCILCLELVRYI